MKSHDKSQNLKVKMKLKMRQGGQALLFVENKKSRNKASIYNFSGSFDYFV